MDARRRILFVEDDPILLDLLQETLADMEEAWDMVFVASGQMALAAFEEAPFDAVVSDLWMPGMNGSQLLQTILVRYPATVRFVLSGCDDDELSAEVMDRAHQFLRKPCDPAFLKSVLRRTFQLGSQVRNDHAKELVARVGRLPSVPALYLEINRLMGSERATVENLGAAIHQDMAMTAMILKLSNSAFFGMRHTVNTPGEAVSILGIDLLRSLVLAHGLFSQAGSFRFPTFGLNHLWRHSIAVAVAAKQIAEMEGLGRGASAEYFTAGLLHDVGILVLASRFPEEYRKVLETTRKGPSDLETAEYHVLGATHGEVGGYLLGLWGLPTSVVQAASFHHLPHLQEQPGFTPVLAVHAADALHSEDPEHEVFSTARLNELCLRSWGSGNGSRYGGPASCPTAPVSRTSFTDTEVPPEAQGEPALGEEGEPRLHPARAVEDHGGLAVRGVEFGRGGVGGSRVPVQGVQPQAQGLLALHQGPRPQTAQGLGLPHPDGGLLPVLGVPLGPQERRWGNRVHPRELDEAGARGHVGLPRAAEDDPPGRLQGGVGRPRLPGQAVPQESPAEGPFRRIPGQGAAPVVEVQVVLVDEPDRVVAFVGDQQHAPPGGEAAGTVEGGADGPVHVDDPPDLMALVLRSAHQGLHPGPAAQCADRADGVPIHRAEHAPQEREALQVAEKGLGGYPVLVAGRPAPAKVVTRPRGSILRITWFPASAT